MFSAALVLALQKPWLALKLPGEDIVSESPCWAPSPSCHAHPVPGLWLYWFAGALLLQMSGGEWECVRGCWPDGRWPPFHPVVPLSVWASRYIYVSTGDPQRPPGPWQSPLDVGGTQETFVDWRSPSLFSCLEPASEFKHCHGLGWPKSSIFLLSCYGKIWTNLLINPIYCYSNPLGKPKIKIAL